ncbi:Organic cation transporter protein [Nymphon striatum]|nr:Organic cation transporter protein [Nymphon striatum]
MSFVGHIFRSNDIGKDLLMGTVYGNRGRDNKTRYSDNIKEIGGGRSFVALGSMGLIDAVALGLCKKPKKPKKTAMNGGKKKTMPSKRKTKPAESSNDEDYYSGISITKVEKSPLKMKDVILHYTGNSGKWQLFVLLCPTVGMFIGAFHNIGISVLAPYSDVDYWCARPSNLKDKITPEEWKNMSIPYVNRKDGKIFDKCKRYDSNINSIEDLKTSAAMSNRTTLPCDDWEFDRSVYKHTIIDKWLLVCDRDILISISTSIYMAGLTIGVFLFGHISDTLGRKRTIMICVLLAAVASVSIAFSTYFALFILLRAILGGALYGGITTAFCLLMEVSSNKARAVLGAAFHLGFCVGMMILPWIAYAIKDWFYIQIVLSIPFVVLFMFACFLPESPKWLIIKNRYKEAVEVIKAGARMNGRNIPDDAKIEENLRKDQNKKLEAGESMTGTLFDLYRTPNLRKKTIIIYIQWYRNCIFKGLSQISNNYLTNLTNLTNFVFFRFVCSFVYHALSLNTGSLGGNSFVNMFLSGAVEFPACIVSVYILLKFGRRIPMSVAQIISGVGCLLVIVVPEGMNWLTVTFAMIGKFGTTLGFTIVHIYSSELYPTVVRNIGLGTSSMLARVGSMLSPFIKELQIHTNVYVPPVISGLACFLAASLVLLLPDTLDCNLPQTIEAAEKHTRTNNSSVRKKQEQQAISAL